MASNLISELPFDWSKHFVYSRDGSKCLGACALMAVKYWGIDISDEECQRVLSQLQVPAFEGSDAGQVLETVELVIGEATEVDSISLEIKLDRFFAQEGTVTTTSSSSVRVPLKQEFFHAKDIASLRSGFMVTKPIPQIVIYDEVLATFHEESAGGHACIVQRLDLETRFVYLIDPNAQARRTPMPYAFEDFERGWKSFEQSTCIIYPSDIYRTARSLVATARLGATA